MKRNWVLSGYVAFLDPPKETAREAIAALREHGIAVKIITGDNEVVTRKICKEVGLPIEHAMLGRDIEKLSDAQLARAANPSTCWCDLVAGTFRRFRPRTVVLRTVSSDKNPYR
jgi:Mg2+-importing ATPase